MSGDPFPLVTVEVAFEQSTNTPPTYTDVSADHVEAVETSYKYGRQYETDAIEPGTGTLQLNNDAGTYTGNRASSPFYPYVRPQRRIRIRCIVPPGNLLSAATTFLATAAGWAATTNATAARAASPAMAGMLGSLAVTATAAGTATVTSTPRAPVTAGRTYTAGGWARPGAAGRTLAVSIGWYSSAGALLSTAAGAAAALTAGDFRLATVTAVAPAGAVTAAVVLAGGSLTAGETFYAAAATLCPGALASTDLATGRTSSFGMGWPGGVGLLSRVDVPFTDGFARLKRHTLGSAYREEVLADAPFACYPMQEAQGSTAATNIAVTTQPAAPIAYKAQSLGGTLGSTGVVATAASYAFGEATVVESDAGPALSLVGEVTTPTGHLSYYNSGYYLQVARNGRGPLLDLYNPWAVELVFALAPQPTTNFDTAGNVETLWSQIDGVSGADQAYLAVFHDDSGPFPYLQASIAGTYIQFNSYSTRGNFNYDGAAHHVLLQYNGTNFTLWLDGVLLKTQATSGGLAGVLNTTRASGFYVGSDGQFSPLTGRVGYLSMYNRALSSARILQHAKAKLGFPGEYADARIGRILGYAGWPAADRSLEAGVSPLGPHLTAGVDATTALQTTAADDGGLLFVDPRGRAVFQNRYHRLNQPSPLWKLDTAAQDVNADLSLQLDDARVVNIVSASTGQANAGTTVRVTDETSRGDYGDLATDVTLNLANPLDLEAGANWTLAQESQPQPRSSTLTVDPLTSAALWEFALLSALGDVVQLINLPAQAPASSMLFLLESKTWTYVRSGAEGRWTVACEISPYLPTQAQVATFTGGPGDPLPTGVTDPHTWDAFADFDGSDAFAW